MKSAPVFLLCLLFCAKHDVSGQAASKAADTVFIYKNITENYRHIIYIEKDRKSPYYDRLTDFSFDSCDSLIYSQALQNIPSGGKKSHKSDLPKEWIPVYNYGGTYYLYAPSDWGNTSRRIISDDAFVYWFMDGPYPVAIDRCEKVSESEYVLHFSHAAVDSGLAEMLTIYTVDLATGMAVFKYKREDSYEYKLYIPAKNARKFGIIVNRCDEQKQFEYIFDPIDSALIR